MTLEELFTQHVMMSMVKQHALEEFLGDYNWLLDMEKGTVDFDDGRIYPVQILGSESYVSDTWLWAWANEKAEINPTALEAALQLRTVGQENKINELTKESFPLNHVNGHYLALIAAGHCNADAYFCGDYESGAVFFLIYNSPLAQREQTSPLRVSTVLSEVIITYEIKNHRLMMEAFFEQDGIEFSRDGNTLVDN